jgi:hypothetical protein
MRPPEVVVNLYAVKERLAVNGNISHWFGYWVASMEAPLQLVSWCFALEAIGSYKTKILLMFASPG